MTFRKRTFLVVLTLVALIELTTFGAVLNTTRDNFVAQATRELSLGNLVFDNAVRQRTEELALGVRVLAGDFGFKRAAASGDEPTIRSALLNHAARIDADAALLIGRDQRLSASVGVLGQLQQGEAFPYAGLLSQLRSGRPRHGVIEAEDFALQLVVEPVFAPDLIGWAAFGFSLDDELAGQIKKLTNLEISFVSDKSREPRLLASTLSAEWRQDIPQVFREAVRTPTMISSAAGSALQLRSRFDSDIDSGVEVMLSMPKSEVLQAYGPLRDRLIIILLIAFVLSTFGARILANTVAQPLQRLSAAARRISRGIYDGEVPVGSKDEIGALSAAFNEMQQGIRAREEQIEYQARHDVMTGLPNRSAVVDVLEKLIEAATNAGDGFSTLRLNVDNAKDINDSLGHSTGDRLVCELARRLERACRERDVIFRFGGHEFLVVLIDADRRLAQTLARRIMEEVGEQVSLGDIDVRVNLSLGIACFPEHGRDVEDLLRRADIAMFAAQKLERGVAVYEPGDDEDHLRRLRLIADLRTAIETGELSLNFQPKKRLSDGKILAAEALVRWIHPDDGFVSPEEFIPLAEQAGLVRQLTRHVVDQSFRAVRRWRETDIDIGICINISALDLLDEELPETCMGLLHEHSLSAACVTLEITESAIMQDASRALIVLNRLRAIGFRLSIDDFGTGHSSLAQIKRVPADELKIDKSFVFEMLKDEHDAAIVRATIELAHNIGLGVTAEGVESAEVESALGKLGCDVIQGYFLGRPMSFEDFTDWYRSRQRESRVLFPAGDASNDDVVEATGSDERARS